jgi:protein TonB
VGGTAGSPGDTPIPAARVAAPPVALERVLPRYPPQARARGLEGRVLLRAIIDRLGHVEPEVEVRESIAMLDAAAIEALRRWRFSPGRDAGGDTVRVLVEVPMRFQLR